MFIESKEQQAHRSSSTVHSYVLNNPKYLRRNKPCLQNAACFVYIIMVADVVRSLCSRSQQHFQFNLDDDDILFLIVNT